jgi:hypothetical protein
MIASLIVLAVSFYCWYMADQREQAEQALRRRGARVPSSLEGKSGFAV